MLRIGWNLIGHEKELKFLEEHLWGGKVGHAYLFTGPSGIGKFTVAKTFAKILQCPNNFCHTCPTCLQIDKGYHLDTIEIPDDGSSIKIEPVRDIIQRLNMTPQSSYKILLLENIARLTEEAGNSLLKLIEEPTGRTVFVFTAEQTREVLPTILSRMYQVKFKPVPESSVKRFLQEKYPFLDGRALSEIMMLSFGKPGRAIELASTPERLEKSKELYGKTKEFMGGKTLSEQFEAIAEFVKDPEIMREFFMLLVMLLRHEARAHADARVRARAVSLLEKIPGATELIRKNVNPRLVLENLSIDALL